jgi:hypothetical protein
MNLFDIFTMLSEKVDDRYKYQDIFFKNPRFKFMESKKSSFC